VLSYGSLSVASTLRFGVHTTDSLKLFAFRTIFSRNFLLL
jgi:hypothetical protein